MSLKKNINYTKSEFTDHEKLFMRKEVEIVKHKYPEHVPIVVTTNAKDLKLLKSKYLVGSDLSVGQFQLIIRKKLQNKINSTESLFLLVKHKDNGILLQTNDLIAEVYEKYADPDIQMLFIEIYKENTFGN